MFVLVPVHAGGQDGIQVLIFVVAASASQHRPEIGLIHVLGYTASAPIERSKFGLSGEAAMIGGAAEPAEGLLLVAPDAILFVSLKITKAQSIFGRGVALLRHLVKLL